MKLVAIAAGPIAASIAATAAFAQDMEMPFGTEADMAYAQQIWETMQTARLAGPGMIHATPYEGTDPHGMQLETFYTTATIGGHEGDLIVKRNYGPAGVTADAVLADPAAHLGAYTVMYRREAGFDADNKDWFWVKFLPDGTLDQTPDGMALAGRVAKGMDTGCISCHVGGGEDMVFTSEYLTY